MIEHLTIVRKVKIQTVGKPGRAGNCGYMHPYYGRNNRQSEEAVVLHEGGPQEKGGMYFYFEYTDHEDTSWKYPHNNPQNGWYITNMTTIHRAVWRYRPGAGGDDPYHNWRAWSNVAQYHKQYMRKVAPEYQHLKILAFFGRKLKDKTNNKELSHFLKIFGDELGGSLGKIM